MIDISRHVAPVISGSNLRKINHVRGTSAPLAFMVDVSNPMEYFGSDRQERGFQYAHGERGMFNAGSCPTLRFRNFRPLSMMLKRFSLEMNMKIW